MLRGIKFLKESSSNVEMVCPRNSGEFKNFPSTNSPPCSFITSSVTGDGVASIETGIGHATTTTKPVFSISSAFRCVDRNVNVRGRTRLYYTIRITRYYCYYYFHDTYGTRRAIFNVSPKTRRSYK